MKSGVKTPVSVKSENSSNSTSSVASEEKPVIFDEDAVERTMQSNEIQSLRAQQMKERSRFFQYQRQCLEQLHVQNKLAQHRMHEMHVQAVTDLEEKVRFPVLSCQDGLR